MKPDSKGYVRVFVGGKYSDWESVRGDADSILLRPVAEPRMPDQNQMTLSEDPDLDLKDLNR